MRVRVWRDLPHLRLARDSGTETQHNANQKRYGAEQYECAPHQPIHFGLRAVPSNIAVVLNGSNFPVMAASLVFARSAATCS
jgi:hypothetical protein